MFYGLKCIATRLRISGDILSIKNKKHKADYFLELS